MGLVSVAVDEVELEATTLKLPGEIATRHPAALQSAKIAVQMGRDLSLPEAMRLDQLVGAGQRLMVDPLGGVEEYLSSQKRRTQRGLLSAGRKLTNDNGAGRSGTCVMSEMTVPVRSKATAMIDL